MFSHTHVILQPPSSPSSTLLAIAFSMSPTHSTFPTTRSGTIRANNPTTKCRKTSDLDQLAAKRPKTQGKIEDNSDSDADHNGNGTDNNDIGTDDEEDLVPMKGGQGGHKARKQRNRDHRYFYSTYSIPVANHSHRPTTGDKASTVPTKKRYGYPSPSPSPLANPCPLPNNP